jgi:putative MATE family efflux protein
MFAEKIEQDPKNGTKDDIIVQGSTWAAIWHMSWPLVLNMAIISVASFVDVWVAGKLGAEVQAAIGIGGQIWFLMMMLCNAISTGATALVSRFWGARNFEGAIQACRQSILFAAIFGVSSALLGLCFCRTVFHLLGASPKVEELGWNYLKFDLLTQMPFAVIWVIHSIFRAKGNARVPMLIWMLMTALILFLDPFLCLFMHLGISGIGISWLIAASVGVTLDLLLLKRSDLGDCLNFSLTGKRGLSKAWFVRLFRIGIPTCIQDISWVGVNFLLLLIFACTKDPTSCQASWSVGLRLEEMVSGLPMHALGMAVGTIVGQNLGAQSALRAERAGWQVAIMGALLNSMVGALMYLAASPIAHVMSSDARVIQFIVQYLQIVGLCQPFIALWIILFGAMQGAGYTKWPMWASILCLVGFRLPLCWLLTIPFNLGPSGTWLGISISACAIGCVAVWRFQTGVWKLQRV